MYLTLFRLHSEGIIKQCPHVREKRFELITVEWRFAIPRWLDHQPLD